MPPVPVSYRDLERMLADRGVEVDHTTMYRWVQRFAPELEKRVRRHLRPCRGPWHVDETSYLIAASGRSRGMRPGQPEREVRPRVCDVDGALGLANAPSPGSDGIEGHLSGRACIDKVDRRTRALRAGESAMVLLGIDVSKGRLDCALLADEGGRPLGR